MLNFYLEIKEVEKRQKKLKEQIKQEESIAQIGVYWQNEILPNWSQLLVKLCKHFL